MASVGPGGVGAVLLNEEGVAQVRLPARVVTLNREGFAVSLTTHAALEIQALSSTAYHTCSCDMFLPNVP